MSTDMKYKVKYDTKTRITDAPPWIMVFSLVAACLSFYYEWYVAGGIWIVVACIWGFDVLTKGKDRHEIKLPFGLTALHPGSSKEAAEDEAFLRKRGEFAQKYMAEQGWGDNPDDLSFEQIMEIRAQPGWKEPDA